MNVSKLISLSLVLLFNSFNSFSQDQLSALNKPLIPEVSWAAGAFASNVFVKNVGQYSEASTLIGQPVKYGIESGNGTTFITENGIYFGYYVADHEKLLSNPPPNPEKNFLRIPTKLFVAGITFENTQSTSILPSGVNSQYFTYTLEDGTHFDYAPTFDQLTITNLYDNVDLQLSFTHENGLNADFILKNGVSPSVINAMPFNEQSTLNLADGSIKFHHQAGAFQWFNPFQQKTSSSAMPSITSAGATQTIQTNFKDPQFATNNVAIDVEVDGTGNIYIYGSDNYCKLRKYSPAGATIWTHVSPFQGSKSGWYGDLVVEPNGISYISSGNSLGASQKLSAAGAQLYYMNNGGGMELFNMEYNAGALDAAGIICSQPPGTSGIGFLNKQTGVITGITKVSTSVSEERGLYRAPNGTFFSLSGANVNVNGVGILQIAAFDGNLIPIWTAPSGFTGPDFPYNGRPLRKHLTPDPFTGVMTPIPSTHHGIAASNCYVYVYNGVKLTQYNIVNGMSIKSVNIPGTVFGQNDGVQVDDCGGVYVGANGSIVKLNQDLQIQQIVTVPNNVSDLTVSPNGDIIVAGDGFVGSISGLVPTTCDEIKFTVSIEGQDVSCAADDGSATALALGGAAPYTYLWSNGATTKTISGLAPGKYWVDVSSASPCAFFASDTIVLKRNLALTVSNGGTICEKDSIALSATSLGSISWSPTNGLSSSTGPNVKASPSTTTKYYVTATLGSCVKVDSIIVVVKPLPTVEAGPDISKCNFEVKTIQASGTGGSAVYSWTPTTGLNDASLLTPQTNVGNSTRYTLRITNNGCVNKDSMDVIVLSPAPPTNTISASRSSICEGTEVIFDGSYSNLGLNPGFQWKKNGIDIPGANVDTLAATNLQDGDQITLAIISDELCSKGEVFLSNSITMEVNPIEDALFSYSSGTYCSSNGSIISPSTTPATSGGTYSVNPSTGLNVNPSSGSFVPVTSSIGNYTVTYTTSGVCNDSYSVQVSIVNNADASFAYSKSVFCKDETNPKPVFIGGGTPGTFTSLQGGLAFKNASTGEVNLVTSTAGTYSIVNTVNGGASCGTAKDTFEITINSVPSANFTGLLPKYCKGNGDVAILSPTVTGGTFSGAQLYNVNEFKVDSLSAGSYTITYSISQNGCPNSSSVSTSIFDKPNPSFTGLETKYCIDNGTVFLSPSNPSGTFSGNGISGTSFNPSLAGIGTHTIKYKVQNASGCVDSFTREVTINPLPDASFAPIDAEYCKYDGLVTLVPNNNSGVFSGKGVSGFSFNPAQVSDTFVVIKYEITDGNGCYSHTEKNTAVYPAPALTVSDDVSLCKGESIQLVATGSGSFIWSPTNNLSDSTVRNPTASPTVSTTYTVTLTDAHCFSTADVNIDVKPIPQVNAGIDFEKCDYEEVTFAATSNTVGGNITWFPSIGLSNTNTLNPKCTITQTTVYEITVSKNGCSAADQLTVEVNPSPKATFTFNRNGRIVNFIATNANAVTAWEWDFGDRSAFSTNRITQHTYQQEGDFQVRLVVFSECGSDTVFFDLKVDDKSESGEATTVAENSNELLLNIYPNPFMDKVRMSFSGMEAAMDKNIQIAMFNMHGRKVLYKELPLLQSQEIDVAELAKGSYLITIKVDGVKSFNSILVKD